MFHFSDSNYLTSFLSIIITPAQIIPPTQVVTVMSISLIEAVCDSGGVTDLRHRPEGSGFSVVVSQTAVADRGVAGK